MSRLSDGPALNGHHPSTTCRSPLIWVFVTLYLKSLGYLDCPQGKGSLWSFIAHPVSLSIGWAVSVSAVLLFADRTSSTLRRLSCHHHRPLFLTTQQHCSRLLQPSQSRDHCTAWVLDITKPQTHSSNKSRAVSLCGLSNMKPLHPHPITFLSTLPVNKVPNREATARLKQVVPRLSTDLLVMPRS